ncbi:MAG TPA: copper amine oxidase N-terminal domain-containing protein, partial [Candidatus Xenobia bacterium]
MRSKWWLSLCLVVLCCGVLWAQGAGITVLVNGAPVNFDQPPIIVGGSVLVPMRGVFERLGADVVWVPDQRLVRATHGDTSIELQLGASTARINGQEHPLTTAAMSVGGRTMVPLRFISQALGADVRWSPSSRTVAIITAPAQAPPPVA